MIGTSYIDKLLIEFKVLKLLSFNIYFVIIYKFVFKLGRDIKYKYINTSYEGSIPYISPPPINTPLIQAV